MNITNPHGDDSVGVKILRHLLPQRSKVGCRREQHHRDVNIASTWLIRHHRDANRRQEATDLLCDCLLLFPIHDGYQELVVRFRCLS
jgi:hypothetical protein